MQQGQRLIQKLSQRLSPQHIQLMKLLQVPTALLDQRLKEELEVNPALEEGNNESKEENLIEDNVDREADTFDDLIDLAQDDLANGYAHASSSQDAHEEKPAMAIANEEGFYAFLEKQVGLLNLDERQSSIALQLVGSIDEDGYLRREIEAISDDLAFSKNLFVDEDELEENLRKIQTFDPPGVGARSLKECLLLQLSRKNIEDANVILAIQILEKKFDAFSKKHYEKLKDYFNIDQQQLKQAIEEIIKLNPKPGSTYGFGVSKNHLQIVPDFIVKNDYGRLSLLLNAKNAPELRVNKSFVEMIESYKASKEKTKSQKDAMIFVRQKINSAKWFIDAIRQRQKTLMGTMYAIMDMQNDFFLTGDEYQLKPMILKDIAERTHLDISTISRVVNSKYVQTEFGVYSLKFFFSESLQTDSGEEVSTRSIKSIIGDLIIKEDKKKPLSDQVLADALKKEGYSIARRTVAKYREQLNIPVARLRKEL